MSCSLVLRSFPKMACNQYLLASRHQIQRTTVTSLHTSRALLARLFTDKHEWVDVDDNVGTVGISNYAQGTLGDIVYISQPDIGQELEKDDEAGSVESVKAASEVYTPVSGTVTEVNQLLEDKPSLVNTACYTDGWLFKIKLSKPEELKALMDENAYLAYLKTVEDH